MAECTDMVGLKKQKAYVGRHRHVRRKTPIEGADARVEGTLTPPRARSCSLEARIGELGLGLQKPFQRVV